MTGSLSHKAKLFADSILYSYAQILFSNRRWFGALLLVATFVRPTLGLLALAGVVISNVAAYVLKYDNSRILSGFYGFNGILFGSAVAFYFPLTPFLLLLFPIFIVITFLIATALENYLAVAFNLPGLSLPFVFSLYILIIFLGNYSGMTLRLLEPTDLLGLSSLPVPMQSYFHALALIFFQTDLFAGLLIAIAILLFSRVMFVLTIAGFITATFFAGLLLHDKPESFMLLAGFNGILTAIALGGSLVIPSRKSFLLAIIAILMVVIFTGFFARFLPVAGLPVFVLPFNCVVLATLYSLKFRHKASGLVLLYFLPGSPEENYYYHRSRQERFDRFRYFNPDLPFLGEWTVSQGHDGDITHSDLWSHAWDFVITDEHGKTYENGGTQLEHFYCYKLPIIAPLDGEVVLVVDSIPNNKIGDSNLAQNWGNTIILAHGEGLYSAYSHLEPGSAKVIKGMKVKRGTVIALCGNSGRSPEPHLHFQFQTTDKLGDRTLRYPFGYFLEEHGEGYVLQSAAYPREKSKVQNLIEHRYIRESFRFPYGTTSAYEYRLPDGSTVRETWTVRVDPANSLYLVSSAGATAGFIAGEKAFFFTSFQGNRNSALYYFYLCAVQVPMAFQNELTWKDVIPLSAVLQSTLRYLSEPLLFIGPQMKAEVHLKFGETNERTPAIIIESELSVSGKGLFSGVLRRASGELRFSPDGDIDKINYFKAGEQVFTAKRVPVETNQTESVNEK